MRAVKCINAIARAAKRIAATSLGFPGVLIVRRSISDIGIGQNACCVDYFRNYFLQLEATTWPPNLPYLPPRKKKLKEKKNKYLKF